ALTGLFGKLRPRHPHTPLAVLSSLAEDAERLVARVALANHVRLIVPLPCAVDCYERRLATDAARAEFRALIAAASRWFVLDDAALGTTRAGDGPGKVTPADIFIARHCQILIAVWDGEESAGDERITELVDLKLDGVFDGLAPANPFDSPETGPVYQVVTRPPSSAPAVVRRLYPGGRIDDPQDEESYRRV